MPQTPEERSSAARKASQTRKRRLTARKAVETRKRRLAVSNENRSPGREVVGRGGEEQLRPRGPARSVKADEHPPAGPGRMKALSSQQPFAWAIVNLGKVENRSWPTKYRGPVLIHAGKRYQREEFEARARDISETSGKKVPSRDDLDFGGVIGRANLIDCVFMPKSLPQGSKGFSPWHEPGSYGFVFADCEPLPFRSVNGALGLFELPGPGSSGTNRRGLPGLRASGSRVLQTKPRRSRG